jgi:hypothetical protein
MIGTGPHRCIYRDEETGNMFVVSTWFGTLVRVQAKGMAKSTQSERYWAVHCLAKEDVEKVSGGILFWGMILEQMSYITEPTAADELRAYEQLWRRPWSSNVALMNTEALSA